MLTAEAPAGVVFDDLRSFIESCQKIDSWYLIEGVDWDLELGALTEATAEQFDEPPLLLYDRVKGYPAGYRVVTLLLSSRRRAALSLGLPLDKSRLELTRLASSKIKDAPSIPPVEVASGSVMENVFFNEDVNLLKFPSPRTHTHDGGRYIGTGVVMINRDPQTGFVNLGGYRMQVHEPALLGLWMSPGQHGRRICQSYWQEGKSCPVVATFGGDPLTLMASWIKIAWGKSELDFVGGLRGCPLEVIKGPVTGLPIPAHAEIAIEGEIPPPDVEAHAEGPFGEWTGYYSGGSVGTGEPQPVIKVKALYHRNDPILLDYSPLWPGACLSGINHSAGHLWDQLEQAGVPDVVGVYMFSRYMMVVAIRQRYPGHAKQAGHAVLAGDGTRNGRWVVIVDDDIDPTDLKEVLWAMQTRVDPAHDIELVDGCLSTPLDPRMPPDKRRSRDYTNSRAIVYAVRPFAWREQFPSISRSELGLRRQVMEKYRGIVPFPALV